MIFASLCDKALIIDKTNKKNDDVTIWKLAGRVLENTWNSDFQVSNKKLKGRIWHINT